MATVTYAQWTDSTICDMDTYEGWMEAENITPESCLEWCQSPERGADFMLEINTDTCCEYAAWNDGTADCYVHSSGDTEEQTENLEEGATSTSIFQYTELEEYEESEWEEDWDEDYYDEEDWYGGCDWEEACFMSIGSMHFFCRE